MYQVARGRTSRIMFLGLIDVWVHWSTSETSFRSQKCDFTRRCCNSKVYILLAEIILLTIKAMHLLFYGDFLRVQAFFFYGNVNFMWLKKKKIEWCGLQWRAETCETRREISLDGAPLYWVEAKGRRQSREHFFQTVMFAVKQTS